MCGNVVQFQRCAISSKRAFTLQTREPSAVRLTIRKSVNPGGEKHLRKLDQRQADKNDGTDLAGIGVHSP